MNQWWGMPWPSEELRAPICEDDSQRIEVPVGERCYLCDEQIILGDQGMAMQGVGLGPDNDVISLGQTYQHRECGIRNIMGCYGQLVGIGHSHDVSYREDARRVLSWLHEHGMYS